MPDLELRVVGDDEYVSQYGSRRSGPDAFRDRPRPHDRGAVSVILGRLSQAEARLLVRGTRQPAEHDGVRWGLVATLRSAGFAVSQLSATHRPSAIRTMRKSVSGALRRVERCGCG